MMSFKRYLALFLINNFLSFTRFFKIKNYILNFAGIKVGNNTKVVGPIEFGVKSSIKIGENCWIGKNVQFDGNGIVIIGDNVDIAPNVVFNTGGHLIGNENRRASEGIVNTINIGSGTWIGTRVTIINSVFIGNGCIIAAGSLVKNSINKNTMVAGIPAIEKKKLYKE